MSDPGTSQHDVLKLPTVAFEAERTLVGHPRGRVYEFTPLEGGAPQAVEGAPQAIDVEGRAVLGRNTQLFRFLLAVGESIK